MSSDGETLGKLFSEDELTRMAKEELNEDPKRVDKDIKAIREWIKKQPHLAKSAKQGATSTTKLCKLLLLLLLKTFLLFADERFLLAMLRGSKFSLEKTKRKIEAWNTIRNLCPEIFDGWDVEDPVNREILSLGLSVVVPGYDRKGRKVVIQRFNRADPKRFTPDQLMKVNCMITDVWMTKSSKQSDVSRVQDCRLP